MAVELVIVVAVVATLWIGVAVGVVALCTLSGRADRAQAGALGRPEPPLPVSLDP